MDSYNNSTAKNNNWMYMGAWEWTISRNADFSDSAFGVLSDGRVRSYGVSNVDAVRPVFNLEPSIAYKSGSGTQSDPIIIN